ncbi:MAG: sensor histidine kinase, partial [Bdellovibrionales bacterium]
VVAQLSTVEETNKQLRRQLNEAPRAGVVQIADPIVPAGELASMDFMDAIAALENNEPVRTSSAPQREEISATGSTSLANVVGAAIRALDKRISENKINVMHFGLEDLKLHADSLQLQTAIEEVLKNSIEAMATSPTRNLTVSGRRQGDRLRLIIEDTGTGIPEGNVAKVFDPFFSTKDTEGVARGLGLNVVRRVVEELEGSVKIHSQQNSNGAGTRVEIDLPADKESTAAVTLPDFVMDANETAELEESEEFEIAGIPSVSFQEKKEWPEFSIRKPIVRTLD